MFNYPDSTLCRKADIFSQLRASRMRGAQPVRVRFGAFEFDLKTGELLGPAIERRIVLSDQMFCLLVMLVKREGAMVTREEIQKKFWPNRYHRRVRSQYQRGHRQAAQGAR